MYAYTDVQRFATHLAQNIICIDLKLLIETIVIPMPWSTSQSPSGLEQYSNVENQNVIPVTHDVDFELEDEQDDKSETSISAAFYKAKEDGELSAEWEVDKIVGQRLDATGETEYLVMWKNSHHRYNEWFLRSDLEKTCCEVIAQYESAVGENIIQSEKSKPIVKVGSSWLVQYMTHGIPDYCWVFRGRDGHLKCRERGYVHYYYN